jgi:acyl-coenzyme A synthetase/AMP-(fatty) acid ligase
MRDTFMALLNGASVFPYDVGRDGVEGMAAWLTRERITVYMSVATVFRRFARTLGSERFPGLRILNLGGEALLAADVELYRRVTGPTCWFVNNLGTTETGTFPLFIMDRAGALPGGIVPAGYALDECEVSLLDASGRAVEGSGPGEIALTSRFLPLGYWRRAALTRAAYRPEAGRRGVRTYRTGDQGRRLADGCLVHLGRGTGRSRWEGIASSSGRWRRRSTSSRTYWKRWPPRAMLERTTGGWWPTSCRSPPPGPGLASSGRRSPRACPPRRSRGAS